MRGRHCNSQLVLLVRSLQTSASQLSGEDNAESDPRPPTEARQLYIRQSIEHVEDKYKQKNWPSASRPTITRKYKREMHRESMRPVNINTKTKRLFHFSLSLLSDRLSLAYVNMYTCASTGSHDVFPRCVPITPVAYVLGGRVGVSEAQCCVRCEGTWSLYPIP